MIANDKPLTSNGTVWNYETIKKKAKEFGLTVSDLIELSNQNDPFYVGTNAELAMAEWFADVWRRFCDSQGITRGAHLRRIHYWLVNRRPPPENYRGERYENTTNEWQSLCRASKYARYLELVPADAFEDRRNPDPKVYADYQEDPTPRYARRIGIGYFDLNLPSFSRLPYFEVDGYSGNLQPYHLEIWCEKTTMNDVLLPVCQEYNVNLVTGAGEMSITSVLVGLMERIQQAERPCRIFYISDFDPAGAGMPFSVARKVQFDIYQNARDFDVRLHPIALTLDQVHEFDLPTSIIKKGERRREEFMQRYGVDGAVELDALEGNYPGELRRIVTEAIERYHDSDIEDQARRQKRKLEKALRSARSEALEDTRDRWAALEEDYDAVAEEFRDQVKGIKEKVEELHSDAYDALEDIDIDVEEEYPLPEPEAGEEINDVLYSSTRDYLEQLEWYNHYRGNEN